MPHISGADGAGEVSAVGRGVSSFSLGDRVVINASLGCGVCEFCISGEDNLCRTWKLLGETVRGTLAEYVVVPAVNLLLLPAGFDFESAAAAGLVFHTAWHSLISRGHVQPCETVLVVGASGGVNTASIQVAKLAGATVFVVGSSEEKLRLAESLGADVLIDRSKQDNWSKAVYEANARRGMDVVVDNVGAGTMMLSLRALRKGGRLLTVGNTGGAIYEMDNRLLFGKHLSIIGSSMGTRSDFAAVMGLVFRGRLQAVRDREFPLSEIRSALGRLESGQQLGKIILGI
jgi:NADPH:quinone reductase-like Zn-dependent oxidoreductase